MLILKSGHAFGTGAERLPWSLLDRKGERVAPKK